jgi:multidrug transporter EmrE-like cation transporter
MLVNIVALLIFIACLSTGQLLFKTSAAKISPGGVPYGLLVDPVFYVALTLYGGTTVLWIWILTRMPLSVAYPWVAGTMIVVPILSNLVFGESLSARFWTGCALVVAGIVVINVRT